MSTLSYLDVDYNDLPNQFPFTDGQESFNAVIWHDPIFDNFYIDLYDANMISIVLGVKLVYNHSIWRSFNYPELPAHDYVPKDESLSEGHIGSDNFGDTVKIYIDDFSDTLDDDGTGGQEEYNPDNSNPTFDENEDDYQGQDNVQTDFTEQDDSEGSDSDENDYGIEGEDDSDGDDDD